MAKDGFQDVGRFGHLLNAIMYGAESKEEGIEKGLILPS